MNNECQIDLRDHIAISLIPHMYEKYMPSTHSPSQVALAAYEMADAMLEVKSLKSENLKIPLPEIIEPKSPIAPNSDTPEITYAITRELIISLASTHKKEVLDILKQNGLTRLSDLLGDPGEDSTVTNKATLESVYYAITKLEV